MMERISYKTIIIILLVTLALLSIIHTLIAKQQFRNAALHSQAESVSRVVEVASTETLKIVHKEAFTLATGLQFRLFNGQTRQLLDEKQLRAELDDLFTNGFSGASSLDLAKLRVYDTQMNLITESSGGVQGLPQAAPRFILQQALARKGPDRLKAIGGIWQAANRPLYSLLLPIGGLHYSGYLEVVLDPLFNLGGVSAMTKLPIRISTIDGHTLFESSPLDNTESGEPLSVEYLLRDENKQPLYRITAYEDTRKFQSELLATQIGSAVTVIIITLTVLLLALFILNRLLFRPVGNLLVSMQKSMDGVLDTDIDEHGVKEVHLIARTFNVMTQNLRNNMMELQRMSSLDGLTGIANRRAFDLLIEQEWTRAQRNRTPLALLLIDIDCFKAYNDSLGHQAGDHCLREVAGILQGEMKRPGDTATRYGGEEFAVILPDTDIFGAGVVALNIRNTLQSKAIPHPASSISTMVTLSIGINVATPGSADSIPPFIGGADRALYMVKHNGRNNICFADESATEPRSGSFTADSSRPSL